MNLKEKIAAAQDRKVEAVEVPEWGVKLYFHEMTVGERMRLYDVLAADSNKDRLLYVYAILATARDEHGDRVFSDEDYDLVASKNPDVVFRLGKLAAHHNRLVGDVVEAAKKN